MAVRTHRGLVRGKQQQRVRRYKQQVERQKDRAPSRLATTHNIFARPTEWRMPELETPVHQLHNTQWKASIQAASFLPQHHALWNASGSGFVLFTDFEAQFYKVGAETKHHSFFYPATLVGAATNPANRDQVYACFSNRTVLLWDISGGRQLHSYTLPLTPQSFVAVAEGSVVVSSIVSEDKCEVVMMTLNGQVQTTLWNDHFAPVKLVVSPSGNFLAGIFNLKFVHIYDLRNKTFHILKHSRPIRCGAFHPDDTIFAFGDEIGHLCLDYDVFRGHRSKQNQAPFTDYHWHRKAIRSITFSVEGQHIYTGGEEGVLVIWRLDGSNNFQPRLGAEIGSISVSHDARHVAVHLDDGAVHILSALSSQLVGTLQGIRGSSNWQTLIAQTGLIVEPRNGLITLNGQAGRLQFFDMHRGRTVYDLTIARTPLPPKALISTTPPIAITRVAFSPTSSNMVTVHVNQGPIIKFYRWNNHFMAYDFLSEVTASHKGEITGLAHHPTSDVVATCGTDSFFKFWALRVPKQNEEPIWRAVSVGCYRNDPAQALAFSHDGSLLAVVYSNEITLWEVATNTLVHVFVSEPQGQNLNGVAFIPNSSFIVSWSGSGVYIHDILTSALHWSCHIPVSTVAVDNFAPSASKGRFLIASADKLILCGIQPPMPWAYWTLPTRVVGVAFQVSAGKGSSTILAMTDQKNIVAIREETNEPKEDKAPERTKKDGKKPQPTAYEQLYSTAGASTTERKQTTPETPLTGLPLFREASKEVFKGPPHILPAPSALYLSYMSRLLLPISVPAVPTVTQIKPTSTVKEPKTRKTRTHTTPVAQEFEGAALSADYQPVTALFKTHLTS